MNKRLILIAKQIKNNENVVDVGTDHAQLPIFLIENNITKNIIATDINSSPLEIAKANLSSKGFENYVELKLTDGLNDIDLNNVDVIVIAGMGATTIKNIIKNFNGRYIIHSTTHIPMIRKSIQMINHIITNEWINKEGNIYNIVIETKPGKMNLSEKEIFLGPILMKKRNISEEYYAFLLRQLIKNADSSGDNNLKLKEREWLKKQLWNE